MSEVVLFDGSTATEYEAGTALVLEAKRRKISYGNLVAQTDRWEREEIIREYVETKRKRRKKPEDGD